MRNGRIKVKTLSFFNVKMNEKCDVLNIVNMFIVYCLQFYVHLGLESPLNEK
jgi:hypothetical protein